MIRELVYIWILVLSAAAIHNFRRTRILKTAVVDFAPEIKQHHIVILEQHNRILYAVDFTPLFQSNSRTLAKLLCGQNVPAEVRVKFIVGVDFYDDDGVIAQWIDKPCISNSLSVLPCLDNWNASTMNLYTHNCQHFSAFMLCCCYDYYNNNIR